MKRTKPVTEAQKRRVIELLNNNRSVSQVMRTTKLTRCQILKIANSLDVTDKEPATTPQTPNIFELKINNFYQRQLYNKLEIYAKQAVGLEPNKLIFRLIEKELTKAGLMNNIVERIHEYED